MKKRVLFYLTIVITTLSLQSCVSNYVVSKPITYKSDAKLASISAGNLNDVKKSISSPSKQIDVALASLEKANSTESLIKSEFDNKIDNLINEADSYIGTPYRYGGMTRRGIDCSAFVLSVFGTAMGASLPRVAASQAQEGERVEKENLRKGDLVFFSQGRRISHVGIVHDITPEGEVMFIHASSSRGVMVSPLSDKYWSPKFRFAKRIINDSGDVVNNASLAQIQ